MSERDRVPTKSPGDAAVGRVQALDVARRGMADQSGRSRYLASFSAQAVVAGRYNRPRQRSTRVVKALTSLQGSLYGRFCDRCDSVPFLKASEISCKNAQAQQPI